ncbi:MAG TPA: hypothetical protein DCZ84_01050 [Candidatus Vogelbacteria bacterium]|uniref:Uncharacterized protein n=1 Tax=Candidatus Vogelbacteria bacterium RIFOXYD1_FULL_51_18 TaxID=1802440 RepID=A0A1G2QML2_9BACT|nr:MAG: hypothetical protein A2569_02230 [Candidatus Vogelbacteria bacterium RIFOXYD1_FULL_51_18]HBB65213.1 hypothetical protein [Candidatus Vogelbacteria bacterium]HBC44074.1 hypothetical protein [Candidatus Vogelbacteria bacterium]HCQ92264.1 hypothetical protein [Candidatus Vogelbacteria bacterium]
MSHDLILKKLEQMQKLLHELQQLLDLPFSQFKNTFTNKEFIPLYNHYIQLIQKHVASQS